MVNLLTAKHWQIFILIIAPIALQVILFFKTFQQAHKPPIELMLVSWIGYLILMSWLYAIGSKAASVAPSNVPMRRNWFKFSVAYPAIYFVGFFAFFSYSQTLIGNSKGRPENVMIFFGLFMLIFPLHILAMACMIYNLYYASRALKAAELQRKPELIEYIADIALFWFFFVGVWVIQPRVNEVLGALKNPGEQ